MAGYDRTEGLTVSRPHGIRRDRMARLMAHLSTTAVGLAFLYVVLSLITAGQANIIARLP
jgi:hypothetical protein